MFIIDVQGFSCGSTFICKEIAILNVANGTYVHKMMGYILRNINGLQWSTCSNEFLNYEQLSEFTKNTVKDNVVLVKGLEKKKWLERFISNRIIDLHDEGCPNLEKLKTIFKSYHCNQHFYNDLHCALENVMFSFITGILIVRNKTTNIHTNMFYFSNVKSKSSTKLTTTASSFEEGELSIRGAAAAAAAAATDAVADVDADSAAAAAASPPPLFRFT
nr:unnamed protein product [Callosobruchus analis]